MPMVSYANRSGHSGVAEYDMGDDFIKVRFQGKRTVYVYDGTRPGSYHVERMKELALAGLGLATYINQHIRKRFARKE